ncbi:MAG: sigma-70 family RNA polymerase sigma factor [bacterium]|nr:sigma-70 family RNA polymerase sigma factor [bacterium]
MTNNESTIPTPESLLQHASWAHSLARSLVGEAAAEDLVQDTWLAALKAEPSTDRSLKPWLGTVLGNLSRQSSRGSARRRAREEQAAKGGFEPSAGELTERAESQKLLMEQLLKLDEDLREVLLLKFFEDLSAAEIGRRKGVPASTIKTRIQRGLDEMRASLDSHFDGERNSWGLALLPLLRVGNPRRGLAAAGSGGIGLKLIAQVLFWLMAGTLGAVALIASIGGLTLFSESIPTEHVTFEPLVPLDQEVGLAPAEMKLRQPIEPSGVESIAPAPVTEKSKVTRLRARFLDGQGDPVTGVQVQPRWGRVLSSEGSDALGRIEFPFELGSGPQRGALKYTHPFLASDVLEFDLRPGTIVDLGDIHVRAGGALSGRVVDGLGQALVGAHVRVAGAEKERTSAGGMVSRRSTSLGAAGGYTDADGGFRFTGLLAGNVRVQVEAQQGLHTAESGWVPIRAGQESHGLVIVAPEMDPGERIEGYVFGPDGEPAARASVSAKYKTFMRSGSKGATTNAEGFFRILTPVDTGHTLTFAAPINRDWASVMKSDVHPGSIDLKVSFSSAQHFVLLAEDRQGKVVRGLSCTVLDANEDGVLQSVGRSTDDTKGLQLLIPTQPAILSLRASGFASQRIELARGEVLEGAVFKAVMDSLPGVTGIVMHNGKPVADAEVFLQAKARGKSTYNGFPVRFDGRSASSTRTAADGTFYLDLTKSGDYVVRATASGFAPAESAAMSLSPESGEANLKLHLSPGGSIEGKVTLEDGLSPAGKIVAVSRGDCWAETQRVQPDGTFRFDNLISGAWMVKMVDEAIHDGESSSSSGIPILPHRTTPSNCTVTEGAVTRFDLIPVPLSTCVLRGQLDLRGVDMSTWSGSSAPLQLENQARGGLRTNFTMDAEGRFELRAKGAGQWRLTFESPLQEGLRFQLTVDLKKGLNDWKAEVPTAQVTLTGTASEPYFYLWRGTENLFAVYPVSFDSKNECVLGHVPAGPAGLVLMSAFEGLDPQYDWPTAWMQLDLPAGSNQVLPLRR